MTVHYYNLRLVGGRVYFLANGFLREARYGVLKSDHVKITLAA